MDTDGTADTADTADTVQLAGGAAPVAEPEEEMAVLPGGLLELPTTAHGPPLDETSSLREMKGTADQSSLLSFLPYRSCKSVKSGKVVKWWVYVHLYMLTLKLTYRM